MNIIWHISSSRARWYIFTNKMWSCLLDYYILSYPTWLYLILSKMCWNLSLDFAFMVFRAENLFTLRLSGLDWNIDRSSSPCWYSSTLPSSSMFPNPIARPRIQKRQYLNISRLLLRFRVWHLVLYVSFVQAKYVRCLDVDVDMVFSSRILVLSYLPHIVVSCAMHIFFLRNILLFNFE